MTAFQIASVNGVRLDRVAAVAIEIAKAGMSFGEGMLTADELAIAKSAARSLAKWKADGHDKDVAREAFWRKIIEEANDLRRTKED